MKKYDGLCWEDLDDNNRRITSHPDQMSFEKKRGDNQYHAFGCMDEYDLKKDERDQGKLYDVWRMDDEFYDNIYEYYEKHPELNVKCYRRGGGERQ